MKDMADDQKIPTLAEVLPPEYRESGLFKNFKDMPLPEGIAVMTKNYVEANQTLSRSTILPDPADPEGAGKVQKILDRLNFPKSADDYKDIPDGDGYKVVKEIAARHRLPAAGVKEITAWAEGEAKKLQDAAAATRQKAQADLDAEWGGFAEQNKELVRRAVNEMNPYEKKAYELALAADPGTAAKFALERAKGMQAAGNTRFNLPAGVNDPKAAQARLDELKKIAWSVPQGVSKEDHERSHAYLNAKREMDLLYEFIDREEKRGMIL